LSIVFSLIATFPNTSEISGVSPPLWLFWRINSGWQFYQRLLQSAILVSPLNPSFLPSFLHSLFWYRQETANFADPTEPSKSFCFENCVLLSYYASSSAYSYRRFGTTYRYNPLGSWILLFWELRSSELLRIG
jgi:hypothetical protein